MKVCICVATYRRPEGLAKLLDSLGKLEFNHLVPAVEVIVVDNAASREAGPICADARNSAGWPIRYVHEPRRGIPYARNRALDAVLPEADFVAFIDDDETADPQWLQQLLRVQKTYEADIVAGAVVPCFDQPPPAWSRQGDFFGLPRYATGTRVNFAYTNNALFRAKMLRDESARFNEQMALIGGSDTYLSKSLHQKGYHIVYANEAIVFDHLPPSRVCLRWLLQRAYRYGNTQVFVSVDLLPRLRTRICLAVSALRRLAKGTWKVGVGWLCGAHHVVAGLMELSWAGGMVSGLLGIQYREYRSTHGN